MLNSHKWPVATVLDGRELNIMLSATISQTQTQINSSLINLHFTQPEIITGRNSELLLCFQLL